MNQLSVEELAQWRNEGREFTLLDVREPDEVQTASIDGATYISMREIPPRLHELAKERTIAVMCHHGGRSERVAAFLDVAGFTDVYNVDGGIDAYSLRVDPSIPRY